MKQKIINALDSVKLLIDYRARYNDGHNDLVKGHANGTPISVAQKKEIESFWHPYLKGWRARKSFDMSWFDIYNRTNVFGYDLRYYIPDSYYYCIVDRFFSDALNAPVLDDKNMYDLYFSDVNQPMTIARKIDGLFMDEKYNIISEEEVMQKCQENGSAIIKPAVGACAGSGITFWRKDKNTEEELREALYSNAHLVIQNIIQQHDVMACLNESSVNTLRMVTLLWKGKVRLTTAVAIMGGVNSKTNHLHGGGLVCGLLPNGQLQHAAFDGKLTQHETLPNGTNFTDIVIPNYDKCVKLVKQLATRLSRVSKLTAWDITIDKDGEPMLIEVNLSWGGSVQIAGGPVFGEITEEVLDYICKKS